MYQVAGRNTLRLLYVGESWLGSCARSLKEALARRSDVCLDEVNEDLFFPKAEPRWLRAVGRLLEGPRRRELYRHIRRRVDGFHPDVVMMYKGFPIEASFIDELRTLGCNVVNVYPDASPHAHGALHRSAVGAYDLVISTKAFHPALWRKVYHYDNQCEWVPQGYDPYLHLVSHRPTDPWFDVTLVATWRHEYGELMGRLARALSKSAVSVAIAGHGWQARRDDYPRDWVITGPLQGRSYVEWVRRARICLAPVTRRIVVGGTPQPGDEDSTRTYELAAACCFFVHQRTALVARLYEEGTEVPMFDSADELAAKILYFLPRDADRDEMALAAHRRAIRSYSLDARATSIVGMLKEPFLSGCPK